VDWEAWTDGLGGLVVPTVVVLVFAVALWSDRARARKLAKKWGVPEPTTNQVDEVLKYRRLRLVCYPLLYVTAGACLGLFMPLEDQDGRSNEGVALIAMFLFGAVIAELLAFARSRQPEPMRLRLVDVVSRWGVGVFGTLVLATYVLGLIDLQAQPHITPNVLLLAEQNKDHVGVPIAVPFVGTAFVLMLVAFVVWSAQARSFSADAEVDRAVRTRSARVVLGLGIAMQLSFLALTSWRMEFLDYYATGADLFGTDPTEVAIRNWAQHTSALIQPWEFLIFIIAMFSWIYVANPRKPSKPPSLPLKDA
jgi:hypothetical protein